MPTITATIFKAVLDDDVITATNAEYLIDLAIDMLNLHGADLGNMTGTAGSKTWSGESKEKGAVMLVARAIYHGFFKGIEPVGVEGVSVTTYDLLGNTVILRSIQMAARRLTELEVDVG